MVAVLILPMVVAVGLVYDGGEVMAVRVHDQMAAVAAARAGAQVLAVSDRTSTDAFDVTLDPVGAAVAAEDSLTTSGLTGSVSVLGTSVAVTVRSGRRLAVLGLIGLGAVEITESGVAQATPGITGAGR